MQVEAEERMNHCRMCGAYLGELTAEEVQQFKEAEEEAGCRIATLCKPCNAEFLEKQRVLVQLLF